MQANHINLPSNKLLSNARPLYLTGFSIEAGLCSLNNNLIYAAGNHLVVDPIDQESQIQYTLKGHDNSITSICVNKNGLIASGQLGSPGNKNYDSPVFVWKLSMAKPICHFQGLKEGVKGLFFSENGAFLAGASHKDQLVIWDINSHKQIYAKIFQAPVNILYFNNESLVITVGKTIQQVNIMPLLTQNKPPIYTSFTLPSTGLPRNYTSLVKTDEKQYLVGTQSGQICLFEGGVFRSAFMVGKGKVYSIGILANQIDVVCAVGTELVRSQYISSNLKERNVMEGYHGRKININQKDQVFVMGLSGLLKGDINLNMNSIRVTHNCRINGVSCKNGTIASIDEAGTVICRKFANGKVSLVGTHYSQPNIKGICIQVSPTGNILAGKSDGSLACLSNDCRNCNWQIGAHKGAVTCIYSGQNYFLSGGEDCVVRIWANATRQLMNQISVHQKSIIRVLGDYTYGHIIHSASEDRSIHAYDMKSDKKISFRQAASGSLSSMDQSSSTGDLVTCGPGSKVSVWKANDYQPFLNFDAGETKAIKVSICPDGKVCAVGTASGDIHLINISKGGLIGYFGAHSRQITAMGWINNETLVSVSEDRVFGVWSIGG